jgi:hypothetical protein
MAAADDDDIVMFRVQHGIKDRLGA